MSLRNPPHPGRVLHDLWLEGRPLEAAAERVGVDVGDLRPVLDGEAPLTPKLALALEVAGISNADFWTRMQGSYDLAQERLRIERETGVYPETPGRVRPRSRLLPPRGLGAAGSRLCAKCSVPAVPVATAALVIERHSVPDRPSGWRVAAHL